MYVETGILENLPTYQMSQDGLESLFGRVRSLNGNKNILKLHENLNFSP